MKALVLGAMVLAGCSVSLTPAFAISNSPQGAVVVDGDAAPWFGGDTQASPPRQAHFLMGQQASCVPAHRRHVAIKHHVVCRP